MDHKNTILILGIGNEVLGDESLGLLLVHELEKEGDLVNTDFKCISLGGLNILEYIQGYQILIIIDTIQSDEGIPGTITGMTINNFRETLHLSSRHDVPFLTSLVIGRKLGFIIPDNIFIITVEIKQSFVLSQSLSNFILKRFKNILAETRKLICKFVSAFQIR